MRGGCRHVVIARMCAASSRCGTRDSELQHGSRPLSQARQPLPAMHPPKSTLALPPPASPSPHPSLSAPHLRVTHSEGLSLQAQVRVKLEGGAAALDGDRDGHGAVRPNCQLALHRLQCKEGGKQDVKVMMMTLRVDTSWWQEPRPCVPGLSPSSPP